MGLFRWLPRRQPPRPTALELAEANEMRLKNAKEAAARERQRLIVEWLRARADRLDLPRPGHAAALWDAAALIETGEPLRAIRPEERPPGRRSHR
jgi:hypothetical protein